MAPDQDRGRLLRLLRKVSRRLIPCPPHRPVDVRFAEITDPVLKVRLTPSRAWDILIEQLDAGVLIQPIALDQPPGKTGYVVLFDLNGQGVYVKLEIGDGDRIIYLRSYHLSTSWEG